MNDSEKLKELRKALSNIKQGEFAKRISTTQGHISDIENGRKGISPRTAKIICSEFNVNENWLLTGEGSIFNETTNSIISELTEKFGLDSLDQRLVMEYAKLSVEQRKRVKAFIKNVLKEETEIIRHSESFSKQSVDSEIKNPAKLNYGRRRGPLFEYATSAGTGAFIGEGEYEIVDIPEGAPLGVNFGVKIKGKSMEPDIPNKSVVWVRQQPDVNIGDICIVIIDDGVEENGYCKIKRDGYFESINPDYENIIPTGPYRITGKVEYVQESEE